MPVTAKLRLGWDSSCIVAPELARRLEKVGIRQITVHGRTTEQRFKGEVNHAGIREVVEAVDAIPVIGNGDVTTPEGVIRMMEKTGCAGVMIGRGSFSSPWIFRQGWNIQTTGEAGPEPDEAAKIAIIRRYFDLMCECRDERYARTHLSRRISWFGKKLGPCKPLKEAIRLAENTMAVHQALDGFLDGGLRLWSEVEREGELEEAAS